MSNIGSNIKSLIATHVQRHVTEFLNLHGPHSNKVKEEAPVGLTFVGHYTLVDR